MYSQAASHFLLWVMWKVKLVCVFGCKLIIQLAWWCWCLLYSKVLKLRIEAWNTMLFSFNLVTYLWLQFYFLKQHYNRFKIPGLCINVYLLCSNLLFKVQTLVRRYGKMKQTNWVRPDLSAPAAEWKFTSESWRCLFSNKSGWPSGRFTTRYSGVFWWKLS